jgi:beta-xylosidase
MVPALLVSALAVAPSAALSQDAPWVPDRGDGTYTNPVLFADYSDPDVLRVGREYYLVSSSFANVPGLPVLRSRDLVNWTIVGHALPRLPPAFDRPQHGKGVWAPSIRHHNGRFWIYWGDPDAGLYVTTAARASGPWAPPHLVTAALGLIDPCPLWDDDGRMYVVHAWARSRAGFNAVLTVLELSPDGRRVIAGGRPVFDGGTKHPTIEGPKLYKRDGWYWILAPAGGVRPGWQVALRSRSVYGPYEDRIVLAQGRTAVNGPHQGGWVSAPDGSDWFLHFQDRGAYGRVVHLQPMRWKGGWPVMGDDPDGDGTGEPVLRGRIPIAGQTRRVPQTSDGFDGPVLGLQWQWQSNPQASWWSLRGGALRLRAVPPRSPDDTRWAAGQLLLQKLPAPAFTVTTLLQAESLHEGEEAGLVVMGRDYAVLSVSPRGGGLVLARRRCLNADTGGKETDPVTRTLRAGPVELRVEVGEGAVCRFSARAEGGVFEPLGEPFSAREGVWIGAKVGLFARAPYGAVRTGEARVEWFRIGRVPADVRDGGR